MLNRVNKSRLYRFLFLNDNARNSYVEANEIIDVYFDKLTEENMKVLYDILLSDENFKNSYETTYNEKDLNIFSETLAGLLTNSNLNR